MKIIVRLDRGRWLQRTCDVHSKQLSKGKSLFDFLLCPLSLLNLCLVEHLVSCIRGVRTIHYYKYNFQLFVLCCSGYGQHSPTVVQVLSSTAEPSAKQLHALAAVQLPDPICTFTKFVQAEAPVQLPAPMVPEKLKHAYPPRQEPSPTFPVNREQL